jgi:hypothetical protein
MGKRLCKIAAENENLDKLKEEALKKFNSAEYYDKMMDEIKSNLIDEIEKCNTVRELKQIRVLGTIIDLSDYVTDNAIDYVGERIMDVCKSLGVTSQDDIDAIYDYVFEEYSKL